METLPVQEWSNLKMNTSRHLVTRFSCQKFEESLPLKRKCTALMLYLGIWMTGSQNEVGESPNLDVGSYLGST